MAFQLGTLANAFTTENFDISLPAAVVDEINKKVGINENGEFFFDHAGVSGKFGELNGEIHWNDGENYATYENEIQNGGWKGSHKYTSGGDVGQFLQDVFGVHAWATYQDKGEVAWDIDLLNMDASFAVKQAASGTGPSGEAVSSSIVAKLGVDLDLTEKNAALSFKPELKFDDFKYQGFLKFDVPSLENCENYFVNFDEKSECSLSVKSSDLDDLIIFKLKNKFAFVKDGSDVYYVKSENRDGNMVPFNDLMYVSFYYNGNTNGRAFNTIRRKAANAANDLYLTVPLVDALMSEILPAFMAYGQKWAPFFKNLAANPPGELIKAVYWVDQWVGSATKNTFDVSSVVAASRFGYAGYPNSQIVADTKTFAAALAGELQHTSFEDLEDVREFVDYIHNGKFDAQNQFALPH